MKPKLSIIIPVFNGERWIEEALSSTVRAARNFRFELILVDDGSIDQSPQIVEAFSRNSPELSVRFLRNKNNMGVAASLNRGLEFAEGDFIARMDADDICLESRFSDQIRFLELTGCDLCGSWFEEFGGGIKRQVRWPHTEAAVRASMLFQNSVLHPSIVARRSVFDQLRYRSEYELVEDYDLCVRAMQEFRVANVPKPLLRYRRHPKQATSLRRNAMEVATRKVRLSALLLSGIHASTEEQRLHNLIRAPESIRSIDDLQSIEIWLLYLLSLTADAEAKKVISAQWVRACIRAAPLGIGMLQTYRASSLAKMNEAKVTTLVDLLALASLRLDYGSRTFSAIRRFGISA